MVGLVHDVAGDQQCRSAPGQLVELLPQIHAQNGIETDGGLVQHQQVRGGHQSAGQGDARPLSTG
jgi:hypothetical protein